MATFIRFGGRAINLDLVFEIEDYGDRIRLFYAVTSSDMAGVQQPTYSDVEGEAADAFRIWLADHAPDLLDTVADEGDEDLQGEAWEHARPAQTAVGMPAEAQADENPYYGAARMRQMHGAGSDPRPDTADDERTGSAG